MFDKRTYCYLVEFLGEIRCVVMQKADSCWMFGFLICLSFDRKLKRLNLGGNELTAVPQKALSTLDTLKKLEMQENKITKIEEGDFEGKIKGLH